MRTRNYIILFMSLMCTAVYGQRPVNEIEITPHLADTSKQRDLIDIGKSILRIPEGKDVDANGQKVYFSFLPFSTRVPDGSLAFITSTTAGFYLGERKTTYMSKVTFTPYTNFSRRFGLPIRSYVWLKDNSWVIDGDIRILKFPHDTWGLGHAHQHDEDILVDYTYLKFHQHALKRVKGGLFIGAGYNMDYRMNVRSRDDVALETYTGYGYGTERGGYQFSSGVSFNAIFDTRANSINTWDGNYANLSFRVNSKSLGSDEDWQSLYLEARRYHRFTDNPNRQHMLAVRNYFWTVFGSNTPYLELPTLGGDPYSNSGRGFPFSRFRGRSLYYLETEYRRDLTKNGLLGFVAFTNFSSVSGPHSTILWNWNVAAGAGARIKFNKGSGTNIALDCGVSKNHRAVYLSLGEFF